MIILLPLGAVNNNAQYIGAKSTKYESDHNMEGFSPGPQYRILNAKDVMRLIGLSRVTIWRMEHEGKIPKRADTGTYAVGWLDTDIHEWIPNGRSYSDGMKPLCMKSCMIYTLFLDYLNLLAFTCDLVNY